MSIYREKSSTSSNKIIKPIRRDNKRHSTKSTRSKNKTKSSKYSNINKRKRNNGTKFTFNKLRILEIIAKLQIGFAVIIILMIIFSKFNVLETILNDELSVFGGEREDANGSISNSIDNSSNPNNVVSANSESGIENVVFNQSDTKEILTTSDIEISNNATPNNAIISYMKGNSYDEIFSSTYVVDSRAGIAEGMFDFQAFEKEDLTLTKPTNSEPKVLIFHTHGNEQYKDSKDISEGVYLLGETLEKELEEKYGINTVHIEKRYDIVDGKTQILGAYERMEPDVQAMLKKYPSIEVCIDIHRDGLPGDMKQVVDVNGEKYAPLMFVNGLSSFNNKGTVEELTDLANPNLETNLAFSYRLKQATNAKYKGLFKDIYLNAYRYSLHMKPKSILLEVGAQNNTVEESVRSTKKFAEILAGVLKGEMWQNRK